MVKGAWGYWVPMMCSGMYSIKRKDGYAVCGCGEIVGEFDYHITGASLVKVFEKEVVKNG